MGKCMIVTNQIAKRKGKPTIEFYKKGKPQYYCYGYEDKMTDEPYQECKKCPKWVFGDQCDKDFEEAKKNNLLTPGS